MCWAAVRKDPSLGVEYMKTVENHKSKAHFFNLGWSRLAQTKVVV